MAIDDRRGRLERAGLWLRRERIRRGFETAGALAAAIGVDSSRISQYERGMGQVPDDRAEKIARAFGMDLVSVRRNLGLWTPERDEPDEQPDDDPDLSAMTNEELLDYIHGLVRAVDEAIGEQQRRRPNKAG